MNKAINDGVDNLISSLKRDYEWNVVSLNRLRDAINKYGKLYVTCRENLVNVETGLTGCDEVEVLVKIHVSLCEQVRWYIKDTFSNILSGQFKKIERFKRADSQFQWMWTLKDVRFSNIQLPMDPIMGLNGDAAILERFNKIRLSYGDGFFKGKLYCYGRGTMGLDERDIISGVHFWLRKFLPGIKGALEDDNNMEWAEWSEDWSEIEVVFVPSSSLCE